MKKKFVQKDLKGISSKEGAELVDAIIKIASVIYNSGIIVGEKLEMPNTILFDIRCRAIRMEGAANSEKFFTRNLEERTIYANEKKELLDAIRKIAEIINNGEKNIIEKLEIPKKLKLQ
jgi:hypothetical protein